MNSNDDIKANPKYARFLKGFIISLVGIWSLSWLMSCTNPTAERIDGLNSQAYAYHYRNLDSTAYYARQALQLSSDYPDGKAEALNHLAFVSMAKMDYDSVKTLIGSLDRITNNQVELLVADVQMMRLCQRKSYNKDFYVYRERALGRLHRIEEESRLLNSHQQHRFAYACSEFYIVASVYFYYMGLPNQSHDELAHLSQSDYLKEDTLQLLNYLYNVGSGGIIRARTQEKVEQLEFESLIKCYVLARQEGIPFFEAQALQGMSEHLVDTRALSRLLDNNQPAMSYINNDDMPDSLFAGNLAQRALHIFQHYGDVYQTAGAYRTLAKCYWALNDYRSSLICLHNALEEDTVIERAPDLVASIREQLSLAYSAIDDKPNSDYNRNIYLDMQEKTRQDRQLEARAEQLDKSAKLLNSMIAAILVVLVVLVTLLIVLYLKRKKTDRSSDIESLLMSLRKWKELNDRQMNRQMEKSDEICEMIEIEKLHLMQNRRRNLEQRAKLSLVTSITPFIDRMLHEVRMLRKVGDTNNERIEYIAELTDQINKYNEVLTDWIRLRQGQLNLHIESFALQSLFDIVAKSKMGFQLKGISLDIQKTDLTVKADKTLTLFMINTMADNARKFTPEDGHVEIYAIRHDTYAEISICDTGPGMSDTQLKHLFDHKPIVDTSGAVQDGKGHGFGLMNCKGIIEKYKKVSPIFAQCAIGAENTGTGSRFWFRLPMGVVRLFIGLFMSLTVSTTFGHDMSDKVRKYADSIYQCNVNGRYHQALVMADNCMQALNGRRGYTHRHQSSIDLMAIYDSTGKEAAELKWFRSGVEADYTTILNMRNEIAVAALALHRWKLYEYNNQAYTQLFRLRSADQSLSNYVQVMQKAETNKNVAIIILILLLLVLFPAYYIFYYRYRLMYRLCLDRLKLINNLLMEDERPENKLLKISKIWVMPKVSFDNDVRQLDRLVAQICNDLRQQAVYNEKQRDAIEMETDELNRRQYEVARLHVSNSVLDNCLSTLKHETMYYPSRIRQIVDARPIDCDALDEVTGYYKSLYDILSQQALRQTETPMRIDSEMWEMLLDILSSINQARVTWTAHTSDGQYQTVRIPMPNVKLTEQECRQLFTPSTKDVRYLMCRQIIRELGEVSQARACGIKASPAETGIVVMLVIPRNTSFFAKQQGVQSQPET